MPFCVPVKPPTRFGQFCSSDAVELGPTFDVRAVRVAAMGATARGSVADVDQELIVMNIPTLFPDP